MCVSWGMVAASSAAIRSRVARSTGVVGVTGGLTGLEGGDGLADATLENGGSRRALSGRRGSRRRRSRARRFGGGRARRP